jgi:hypothetical protein
MWKRILLVFIVLVVLSFAAKDIILKWAVEAGASQALGVEVSISSLNLSLSKQSLKIKGLKIYNPKGFVRAPMINVSDIQVACNIGDLKKKRIHLTDVALSLEEVAVIRNVEGVLNIDGIKGSPKSSKVAAKTDQVNNSEAKPNFTFLIDELKLAANRVTFTDMSLKDSQQQVLNIKVSMTYNNIDSPQRLAGLVVGDVVKAAGVKGATAYGAKALKEAGISSKEADGIIGSLANSLFKK